MFIEIKEFVFETSKEASENANYPESGFYLVEAEGNTDLRFVDKSIKVNHFICPKSAFDGVMTYMTNPEQKDKIDNNQLPSVKKLCGLVSEEFVIEFTKTLLGKK
ncbi:hypothetical protein HZQ94_08860 [Elizabethkingia anophelis]|uniref:hypothetical protein n=1 Tax=Elizabethkingia anophelis TaxID=1117645 RepID=UPI0021A6D0F5|nr:hypothetical protein [Elizabethkingia anophelis]MCT3680134.1 hypothetical protein [Elizabethkingia anophelis]MCT4253697.1 hypothetical protein [Elizabethkingia anophelis]